MEEKSPKRNRVTDGHRKEVPVSADDRDDDSYSDDDSDSDEDYDEKREPKGTNSTRRPKRTPTKATPEDQTTQGTLLSLLPSSVSRL